MRLNALHGPLYWERCQRIDNANELSNSSFGVVRIHRNRARAIRHGAVLEYGLWLECLMMEHIISGRQSVD